jgi:hypothetical protein
VEIFIPTLARPDRQETWNNLPDSLRERTRLLVDEREVAAYRRFPCVALPSDCKGIGRVRQWVIENVKDKVVMLDDDLTFAMRRLDEPTKFLPATVRNIELIFSTIERCLNAYAHASLATREGGNRCTDHWMFNTRLLRVLAYRADVLREEGISFNRLPVMEDFDVTLQLLRRGYPNITINWAVQNQLGSNLAGGCSTYRSLETQRQAALGLKDLHPDFVQVVTKQTKTAWQGQERTDVKIQWKRAYESAGVARVLDQGAGADPAPEGVGGAEAVV